MSDQAVLSFHTSIAMIAQQNHGRVTNAEGNFLTSKQGQQPRIVAQARS